MSAFEKHGIWAGERVVCVDYPTKPGLVLHCSPDLVTVQWDDWGRGDLIWDDRVAYNAYRLQVVRDGLVPFVDPRYAPDFSRLRRPAGRTETP